MPRISKIILFLTIIVTGCLAARSQSDVRLTQAWALPTYYNPAATGSVDYVRIRAASRLQWLGIENAPKSFLATADMPFMIGKRRLGVGVDATQESLGLFSNLLINAEGSFKFRFLKGTLSAGVRVGYYNSKFKGTEVYLPEGDDYHQTVDEAIPTQDLVGNAFDMSAGVYYTHKYFSLGLSGLHLLAPSVKLQTEGTENSETAQYETKLDRMLYFTADGNIPIKNSLFDMQPSLIVASDFSTFNAAATMRARYNKFLSFGVGYRYNEAVSVMLGAEFKNFFIGYCYDYPTSAIAKASSGSHEIVAGYQLKLDFNGKNKNKHRSIRIM